MARILVYKRPVDPCLIDVQVHGDQNRSSIGLTVKQEPSEPDPDRLAEPAVNDNNGSAATPSEPTVPENQALSNRTNNKENEYLLTKDNVISGHGGSRGRKRKRRKTRRGGRRRRRGRHRAKQVSVNEEPQENGNVEPPTQSQVDEKSEETGTRQTSNDKPINPRQASAKTSTKCNVCFLDFATPYDFRWHRELYMKPRPFLCDKCPLRCLRGSNLQRHIKTCSARSADYSKFKCDYCGRSSSSKQIIQSHIFHSHADLIYSSESAVSHEVNVIEKESHEPSKPRNPTTSEIDLPNNQNSSVPITPSKKMRQTMLTDFIQFSQKQKEEPVSPRKVDPPKTFSPTSNVPAQSVSTLPPEPIASPVNVPIASPSTSAVTPTSSRKRQHRPAHTDSPSSSSATVKPLVYIHANPDVMLSLLNGSTCTVKTEPLDEGTPIIETPSSYGVRQGWNSPENATGKSSSSARKRKNLNSDHDTPKRPRKTDSRLSDSELKAKFGCKELSIPLLKDEVIKIESGEPSPRFSSPESQRNISRGKASDQQSSSKLDDVKVSAVKLSSDLSGGSKSAPWLDTSAKCMNGKPFRCKICSRSFSSKENVREHTTLFHVAYMSSICSAHFKTRRKLKCHYIRAHGSYKRNECCVCGQACESRINLKRHLTQHCIKITRSHKEIFPANGLMKCTAFKKNHKCTHCGKKFWLSTCLKQHQDLCLALTRTTQEENEKPKVQTPPATTDKTSSATANTEVASNRDNSTKTTAPQPQEQIVSLLVIPKNKNPETPNESRPSDESTMTNSAKTPNTLTSVTRRTARITDRKLSIAMTSNTWHADTVTTINRSSTKPKQEVQREVRTSRVSGRLIFSTSATHKPNSSKVRKKRGAKSSRKAAKGAQAPAKNRRYVTDAGLVRYPCTTCGKKFKTLKTLQRHRSDYSRPYDQVCKVCGLSFPTEKLLISHGKSAHETTYPKSLPFRCQICNQGFLQRQSVRSHVIHTHGQQPRMEDNDATNEHTLSINMVCNICNLMFETYDRFIEHNMYYYKGHVLTCTFCEQSFHGMYRLHHHNKLMHYPEEVRKTYTYTCDSCDEGFKHELHFHAHKLHVHPYGEAETSTSSVDETQVSPKKSSSRMNRTALTDDKQLVITTYSCEVCQLSFPNKEDQLLHNAKYATVGDFQCSMCDRKCQSDILLSMHESLSHSKLSINNKYKCPICAEVLTTSTAMTCHEKHFHYRSNSLRPARSASKGQTNAIQQRKVPTAKANNKLTASNKPRPRNADYIACITCGMRFNTRATLRDHLLAYSDIGDHACNICNRRFVELKRLEVHKIKHTRLNSILSDHHCPICQEGFAVVTDVRVHVLHLHGYDTFQNIISKRDKNKTSDETPKQQLKDKSDEQPASNVAATETSNKHVEESVATASIVTGEQTETAPVVTGEQKETAPVVTGEQKETAPVVTGEQTETAPVVTGEQTETAPVAVVPELTATPDTSKLAGKEKPTKCSVCGLKFASSKSLAKHKARYVNKGNYICEVCGRRFPWEATYREHNHKHVYHENTHNLKYICPHCGERFRTLSSAHSHVIHLHAKSKANDIEGPRVITEDEAAATTKISTPSEVNERAWPKTSSPEPNSNRTCPEMDISIGSERDCMDIEDENAVGLFDESYHREDAHGSAENSAELNGGPDLMDEETIIVERDTPSVSSETGPICYKCPICLAGFRQLSGFQVHFCFNHATSMKQPRLQLLLDRGTIDCVICGATFDSEQDFKEHLDKTHMPVLVGSTGATEVKDGEENDVASIQNPTLENNVANDLEVIWEKKLATPKGEQVKPSTEDDDDCQEIIDLDIVEENEDCDDCLVEESIVTARPVSVVKNANVGKLKVRPFAKIIENLLADSACGTSSDVGPSIVQPSTTTASTSRTAVDTVNIAEL